MPISKTRIIDNLKKINDLFTDKDNQSDVTLLYLYSKLSLLELCGWVEVSMELIITEATQKLREDKNIKYIKENVVVPNHGFNYPKFHEMLIKVLGILRVEKLESKLDNKIVQNLMSVLGDLNKQRGDQAHTYIDGVQKTIDAPSKILNYCEKVVYPGLKEIETKLHRIL